MDGMRPMEQRRGREFNGEFEFNGEVIIVTFFLDIFQDVAHENFVTDFIDFLHGSVIGTGLIIFGELVIVDGEYHRREPEAAHRPGQNSRVDRAWRGSILRAAQHQARPSSDFRHVDPESQEEID